MVNKIAFESPRLSLGRGTSLQEEKLFVKKRLKRAAKNSTKWNFKRKCSNKQFKKTGKKFKFATVHKIYLWIQIIRDMARFFRQRENPYITAAKAKSLIKQKSSTGSSIRASFVFICTTSITIQSRDRSHTKQVYNELCSTNCICETRAECVYACVCVIRNGNFMIYITNLIIQLKTIWLNVK